MPVELARLEEIFSEALSKSTAAERDQFLNQACGGDDALRARVEALLASSVAAGSFMAPITADSWVHSRLPAREGPGSTIGRYRVLEQIGEGGFGSVFMAEQEQPVRRRVALKVIKLGMDTRQFVARFEAERQALAMMDHPNIARVLDGGATESGRPYFVMELVRGTPITAFCDEHRLTVRERLELFVQVCQAVQHAHTKGVIHRDLKPSNILAVSNDGTPMVKVIDFGIVKAIGADERLTDKTLFTEFRQLIGTPAYMSPEQAGQSDIDVDTRSDIYSLGVLLYELLTGTTPFDAKSLQSSGYDEMRRVIREVEPPAPSRRLSALSGPRARASEPNSSAGPSDAGALNNARAIKLNSIHARSDSSSVTLANVAAQRRSEPTALVRQLHGDLDWIVMCCLEKDRARRYETASSLAADVQRHLVGEPVIAAPPSRVYRVRKLVHRHRGAFIATALIVSAIIVGLSLAAYGLLQAERHQKQADATGDFLKEVLTLADPARARGDKLTMREALDQAVKRLDDGALRDQPLVEADVRFTIGSTYWSLSLWRPEAEVQFRTADAIQTKTLGDEHPDTLRTRFHLARTYIRSDLPGAAALAQPTFESQRRVLGPDHIDTLQSMVLLGVIHAWAGRFQEGESLLGDAIVRREKSLGKDHVETAYFLNRLGELYIQNAMPEKAEPLHREALRIYSAAYGDEHPDTMKSLEDLGACLHNQHCDDKAEAIYRRLLEPTKRFFGPESPAMLGLLIELAGSLSHQGKYAEAEPIFRETLATQLRILGPSDFDTIITQRWFAGSLAQQGKFAEAETLLRDALSTARTKYGPEDVGTSIRLMCSLSSVLASQHKDAEAEQLARQVVELNRRQPNAPGLEDYQKSAIALIQVLNRRGGERRGGASRAGVDRLLAGRRAHAGCPRAPASHGSVATAGSRKRDAPRFSEGA